MIFFTICSIATKFAHYLCLAIRYSQYNDVYYPYFIVFIILRTHVLAIILSLTISVYSYCAIIVDYVTANLNVHLLTYSPS